MQTRKLGSSKRGAAISFCAFAMGAFAPVAAFAANLPVGFTETVVASFTASPTAMEFSPDGKLFIAQQNGIMPVWKDGAQISANFFANTPINTDTLGERGLLGITFDPAYASNRYVYVYYTVSGGDHHNRVSRYTADASGSLALAGSGTAIWNGDAHSATNHNGGAIHFGPDGKLYIATGDNAQGTPAQSLTSQHGKILRINADGSIPLDNPFHDSVGPNVDAVWSLGLRNPFTFAFQPGTGRMFVNDVGQNTWEEINDGGSLPSGRRLNYGWPTTEGDFNQAGFADFTQPFFTYNHHSGTPVGNVITGGAFYNPTTNTFGSEYQGDYFFSDLGGGWIYRIDPSTKQVTEFATDAGAVDLKVSGDGALYYLAYGSQKVFKVTKAGLAPLITLQPDDQTVGVGSVVILKSDASGGPTFQWQRSDSGGSSWSNINGATSKTLTFVPAQLADNNAQFRVIATNSSGSAASNPAKLTVLNNSAPGSPTITVNNGLTNSKFVAGQTISFSGTATDPEDGALGAGAFSWKINYLTSIDQGDQDSDGLPGLTRPYDTLSNVTSGTFTPATTGPYTLADVAYSITLTVTDSLGLKTTSRVVISPNTSTLTLASSPAGMQLTLDSQPVTAGDTFAGVVGFERTIGATPAQIFNETGYQFVSWSDGGDSKHTIITPASDTTYTATYVLSALPGPWASADVGDVGTPGGSSFANSTFILNGSGFIQGKADSFHFAYLQVTGDFTFSAIVRSLPYNAPEKNARAGIMVRADLTPGSPHMFIGVRAKASPQTVSRERADQNGSTGGAGSASAPCWVRITRIGNRITTHRSSNGVTWNKAGSKTIVLGSTVYLGFAVCSDFDGLQNATFDSPALVN